MDSSTNIFSLNCDSKESVLVDGLHQEVLKRRPILVLLQDLPKKKASALKEILSRSAPFYRIIPDLDSQFGTTSGGGGGGGGGNRQEVAIKFDNIILAHPVIVIEQVNQQDEHNDTSCGAQSIGVDFRLSNEDRVLFKIFSVYIRPLAPYGDTLKMLDFIKATTSYMKDRVIIMGDVNAVAHEWTPPVFMLDCVVNRTHVKSHGTDYDHIRVNRGRSLTNFMRDQRLDCLNRYELGPTYLNKATGRHSYIDIAMVGPRARRRWRQFELIPIQSAEHKLIQISRLNYKASSSDSNQLKFRYMPSKLKPEMFTDFKSEVKSLLTCCEQDDSQPMLVDSQDGDGFHRQQCYEKQLELMDKLAEIVSNQLLQAQDRMKTKVAQRYPNAEVFTQLKSRMMKQIKKCREKQKGLKTNSPMYQKLNRIRKNVASKLFNEVSKGQWTRQMRTWNQRQYELEQESGNNRHHDEEEESVLPNSRMLTYTWETVSNIRNATDRRNLPPPGRMFSDLRQLEDVSRSKFKFVNRQAKGWLRELSKPEDQNTTTNHLIASELRLEEVDMAIKRIRSKSYAGIDNITVKTLVHSYRFIRQEIFQLCRMSFQLAKIPKNCRLTLGKLIPKTEAMAAAVMAAVTAGAEIDVDKSFRIIHISTAISSLLEQIALRKLQYRLEHHKLLDVENQYGFTAKSSRHDLVSRIIFNAVSQIDANQEKANTILISLDIEGAFDNVNQDILIGKLIKDIPTDNIACWVANFILDRQIVLRDGHLPSRTPTRETNRPITGLQSNPRDVCKGVPQGSSLGPILWNYMINNIHEHVIDNSDMSYIGETELLAYADDLFLVHRGSNKYAIQRTLDRLVSYLASLDLRVNPDKSKQMNIHIANNERHKKLMIEDKEIQSVKQMNILGIRINRKLQLEKKFIDKSKMADNVRTLYLLNRLRVIRQGWQWRCVIDGLLRSISTLNNYPILAVDKPAQERNNVLFDRAMRNIFRWPKNISIKLVRLVTGRKMTELDIKELIINRMLSTRNNYIYAYLARNSLNIETPDSTILSRIDPFKRRFHNPSVDLKIISLKFIERCSMPIWIPIETKRGTLMVEQMAGGKILKIRLGAHDQYPVDYFNTMSMIWYLTENYSAIDTNAAPQAIAMSPDHPLLKAMLNWNNHDWRTIETKERLAKHNWMIVKVPGWNLNKMRTQLLEQINLRTVGSTCLTDVPDLTDYKLKRDYRRMFEGEQSAEFSGNHTTVTVALCPDYKVWQEINTPSITSVTMLTLSGLIVNNETNALISGKEILPPTINGLDHLDEVTERQQGEQIVTRRACEDCPQSTYPHTTLHRMFECPNYSAERNSMIGSIESMSGHGRITPDEIKKALQNPIYTKKLFDFLNLCAGNGQ